MSLMYKYTPTSLDEFDIDNKCDLENPVHHRLIIGGERTGKTTLATILVKDVPTDHVLYLNSLQEHGIQFYRNEVKCFCQTTSSIKKRVVIDCMDDMSEQTQQRFLTYIDKYGHNVYFIATASDPQKIIEGMFSRFIVVPLKPAKTEFITELIRRVIKAENIDLADDAIPHLMSLTKNSIRTILNYLEKYKIINQPITKQYIEKYHTDIHDDTFKTFTDHIRTCNRTKAIQCITELHSAGYSFMDILDYYYSYIKSIPLEDVFRYSLIKIICKYIVIFNNLHEHHIELLFFVEDCINMSSESHNPCT